MNALAQLNGHWLAAEPSQLASESISGSRLARFLSGPDKSVSSLQDWRWQQLPQASQQGEPHNMAFTFNCQWAFLRARPNDDT